MPNLYEFISICSFELTLIVIFTLGWFYTAGKIRFRGEDQEVDDWRKKNGKIIKMLCLVMIFLSLASMLTKYFLFIQNS